MNTISKKDPAFLFYSKDWLAGTAEMLPEEKGVYIDLLCHQHQNGDLPTDTRRLAKMVGLSEQEFLPIWNVLKAKFQPNGERLVNRKLTGLMTERSEKGHKNRIIGTLASVFRLSKEPYEKKRMAKEGFKYEEFLSIPDEQLTERLTEWFAIRLKSIGNGNEDDNREIEYLLSKLREVDSVEIGEGQENLYTMIVLKMVEVFRKHNPDYFFDKETDYKAALQIAYKIAQMKKWQRDSVLNGHMDECVESWEKIAEFVKSDKWFSTRSLSDLSSVKEWQRLVQSMKNATPAQTTPTKRMVD